MIHSIQPAASRGPYKPLWSQDIVVFAKKKKKEYDWENFTINFTIN